eukprot:scaffold29_cov251-Pinguiococcus_pyrenoidosus.AAC.18
MGAMQIAQSSPCFSQPTPCSGFCKSIPALLRARRSGMPQLHCIPRDCAHHLSQLSHAVVKRREEVVNEVSSASDGTPATALVESPERPLVPSAHAAPPRPRCKLRSGVSPPAFRACAGELTLVARFPADRTHVLCPGGPHKALKGPEALGMKNVRAAQEDLLLFTESLLADATAVRFRRLEQPPLGFPLHPFPLLQRKRRLRHRLYTSKLRKAQLRSTPPLLLHQSLVFQGLLQLGFPLDSGVPQPHACKVLEDSAAAAVRRVR